MGVSLNEVVAVLVAALLRVEQRRQHGWDFQGSGSAGWLDT